MPDTAERAEVGAVQERIAALASGPIAELAPRVDSERRFPVDGLAALGEVGALGLVVPPEHGGLGGGLVDVAAACESIGGACGSTGMVFLMHTVAAATIAGGGGDRAGEHLAAMAAGRALGSLAFSERGRPFYAPALRAEPAAGGVRIVGRKSFVTSGGEGDVFLTLVRSADGEGTDCYAVTSDDAGVRFEGEWEGLGMAGNSSVAMELDVLVDEASRIGPAGGGDGLVFGLVAPFFLVGLAGVNVGIAQAALTVAIEQTQRRLGGRSGDGVGEPVVQALAEMDRRVRQARAALSEAAALGDGGEDGALIAIMESKLNATSAAMEVSDRALEICGGRAYAAGLPVERYLRDARAGMLMAPSNDLLRTWVGRSLLGLSVP